MLFSRLHESHEVSVYEAIERLVQAGEAVGIDAHAFVRLLDQGKTSRRVIRVRRVTDGKFVEGGIDIRKRTRQNPRNLWHVEFVSVFKIDTSWLRSVRI